MGNRFLDIIDFELYRAVAGSGGGSSATSVKVVDTLPDVGDAIINCLYIVRSTGQGAITTDNVTYTYIAGGAGGTGTVPDFAPDTDYIANQPIYYDNGDWVGIWRAKTDFTSGAAFNPADWEIIASLGEERVIEYDLTPQIDGTRTQFVLSPAINPDADHAVYYNGLRLREIANYTISQVGLNLVLTLLEPLFPEVGDTLVFVAGSDTALPADLGLLPNFESNHQYLQYAPIVVNGIIYRAKAEFVSGASFDESYWEAVSASPDNGIGNFIPNHDYTQYSAIYQDEKIYRAKVDFTSGNVFDENDWEEVSAGSVTTTVLEGFNAGQEYLANELIFVNNKFYSAKTDFVADTIFNPADWNLLPLVYQGGEII